jgi:hypothetical protein
MARRNLRATLSQTAQNLTVRSGTAKTQRLDALTDVLELPEHRVDGAILVYDADSDRYVLRDVLTFDNEGQAFKLDGGAF